MFHSYYRKIEDINPFILFFPTLIRKSLRYLFWKFTSKDIILENEKWLMVNWSFVKIFVKKKGKKGKKKKEERNIVKQIEVF